MGSIWSLHVAAHRGVFVDVGEDDTQEGQEAG